MSRDGIPRRFQDVALNRLTIDDSDAAVAVCAYVEAAKDHLDAGTGLLLVGPPGRGKTRLAVAALSALKGAGHSALYLPMANYQHQLLRLMQLQNARLWDEHEEMFETHKAIRNEVQFLLIDDVGKEHTTSTRHIEDEFDFLLRYRYDAALPTLMTTNVPVSKWAEVYGPSMESFIHEAFVIVPVTGDDHRKGH